MLYYRWDQKDRNNVSRGEVVIGSREVVRPVLSLLFFHSLQGMDTSAERTPGLILSRNLVGAQCFFRIISKRLMH